MIEDRAYQERALAETRAAFARGRRAVLLVAPTGAGKTTIAGMIAQGAVAKGTRVAFIAHRRELIQQAAARFRAFDLEVGVYGENARAPIQVTSPQTILARGDAPTARLVIVDEAHHYAAEEWKRIVDAYLAAGARLVGLSATPERGDGTGLEGIFDHLVVVAQIGELTRLGFLVPADVIAPTRSVRALAIEPVEAYLAHGGGRPAVVFAPHVKAATDFRDAFRARGITSEVVHGELALDDRDGHLLAFARGSVRVVTNVMVLTEGWDCPSAAVCILARKMGSASMFLQTVGRVLRPHPDKSRALVIDLAGNIDLHGMPDEERVWSLSGVACSRRGEGSGIRRCRVCKAEIPPRDELPEELRAFCPECGAKMPELETPTAEGVELERIAAQEAERRRIAASEDARVKILASCYAKALREGTPRKNADYKFRGITGSMPDTSIAVHAWRIANEKVAEERGDAWEPPLVAE